MKISLQNVGAGFVKANMREQTRESKHSICRKVFSSQLCCSDQLGDHTAGQEVLFCSWMRQDELRALQSLESSPVSLTERKQYFGRVTILLLVSFSFNKSKNEENLAMGPWIYRMSYDLQCCINNYSKIYSCFDKKDLTRISWIHLILPSQGKSLSSSTRAWKSCLTVVCQ